MVAVSASTSESARRRAGFKLSTSQARCPFVESAETKTDPQRLLLTTLQTQNATHIPVLHPTADPCPSSGGLYFFVCFVFNDRDQHYIKWAMLLWLSGMFSDLSCRALIVFVITTGIPSCTLQKGLKMCFVSQNLDLDILFREEMALSSVLTWTKYIIVCALVFDAFISNMPYWHEPPIWTVAVYREEVRRGVGGSWGLYTLSLSLSSSSPASQQLPAIFHS